MTISAADIQELRRIATNTYDADKQFVQRLIKGISNLEKEVLALRSENTELKKKLANKKENG